MIKFNARATDCKLLHKSYLLKIGEDEIVLPPKEHALLLYFLDHPGKTTSRDDLLKAVWGEDVFVEPESVDRAVSELRDKLGDTDKRSFIATVRKKTNRPGGGYQFVGSVIYNRPTDDFDPEELLHKFPERVRFVLKRYSYAFFDSLYEHETRDDTRKRIERDQKDDAARTRAVLASRFGVGAVKLEEFSWRCTVIFPNGSILWDRKDDLRGDGYESEAWSEVTLTIDGYDPDRIEWLLQNCVKGARSRIVFDLRGRIDIDTVADGLFKRRVSVTKLSNNTVTVESTARAGDKFVFELSSEGDMTRAEVVGWSAPSFKELRRALIEIRTVFELDKQFDQGAVAAAPDSAT